MLEVYSELYHQTGVPRDVERRSGLSARAFFERYYYPHRPVILRDLMVGWPALERWRPECLAERFGDARVEIMIGRDSDPEHESQPDQHRKVVRLRDFIQMLGARVTNDYYLVGRNFALERPEFRGMLEELRFPEGYLDPVSPPGAIKLWMGPAGTLTALHHDLSCVLFGQVYGRKHFKLIPSFELPRVYNSQGVFSDVDAEAPDEARFPRYLRAHVLEAVLEPGDMLFIPVGWWHWVKALDVSVSVSFQRFAIPEGNTEWRPG
ncbi:cupin-like domain-containing protein [Archangium violaceum]|uniref:cupin-like domain-containing protein n=1 Tax=Archangium violaceum TaxID=83451 RepID=UPI001EF12F65|nr:cupin-like domain-containing protein [Archangium violaceum]